MPISPLAKSLKNECFRKAIHLSSLWMPVLIWLAPAAIAASFFLCLTVADFLIEYFAYKNAFNVRRAVRKKLIRTMRGREVQIETFALSGAFYVLVAAFCCTLLFPREIAAASICVLLVSDSVAAIAGRAFGRTKIAENKSLEGTAAFALSALLVLAAFGRVLPFSAAGIAAVFAATLAELYAPRLKIDDNFTIPLVFGITFMLL